MDRKKQAIEQMFYLLVDESVKSFAVEYSIDHDHRRAAIKAGISPAWAAQLLDDPTTLEAIRIASECLFSANTLTEGSIQDEMWLTYNIALQCGKHATAAKILDSLAKLKSIDAFAANKVEMTVDSKAVEELRKGRERMNQANALIAELQSEKIVNSLQTNALESDD